MGMFLPWRQFAGGKRQANCLPALQPAPGQVAPASRCALCRKAAAAGACSLQHRAAWSGNYSISPIKGERECSGRELRPSLPERETSLCNGLIWV